MSWQVIELCHRGLDACSLRHETISNNIANVNTPGFKRQYVTFEEELKQVLRGRGELRARTTHPRHIQFGGPVDPLEVKPRVWTEENTVFRNDLNNVNIDVEMTNLQKNTLMYEALATIISRKFKALKDVIMRTRP